MRLTLLLTVSLGWILQEPFSSTARGEDATERLQSTVPDDWATDSPRDEIRPRFAFHPSGGHDDAEVWSIEADDRVGLAGSWVTRRLVEGGSTYRVSVWRQTSGMSLTRRAAIVRLLWTDDAGLPVQRDEPTPSGYRPGTIPRAEPEFPADAEVDEGWTLVTGTYRAPSAATQVRVELHFRWGEPLSRVAWSDFRFEPAGAIRPRLVTLAAVHHRPRSGMTAKEKREQFAPLVAEAADRGADLVVLPETLAYYHSGKTLVECAEPIPGPTSSYFASLAKENRLHLVAGLVERDEHLVYNTAALFSSDGELVGTYRKVTLPRSEIEAGVTPGDSYPVYDTSLGRIGMMICYDGFFPEVARELAKNGAEVIAWPVWGCNPLLARARACENHVYVVSSTYTNASENWMETAVYGLDGTPLAKATAESSVVMSKVDLNQRLYWNSLGDFRAQIERHRPPVVGER